MRTHGGLNEDSCPEGKGSGSGSGSGNITSRKGVRGKPTYSATDDKDHGTPTASGKVVRDTESDIKIAAMKEAKRLLDNREIDLAGACKKLRAFGFTHSEINSPTLMKYLQQAAN